LLTRVSGAERICGLASKKTCAVAEMKWSVPAHHCKLLHGGFGQFKANKGNWLGADEMRKHALTIVAMAISTPALAADLSGSYVPPSGDPLYSPNLTIIGDASAAYEFYGDDEGYQENIGEADARVLFRWNNGFSIQASAFGGYDFDHDIGFYNVGTDIFFANQNFAAGIYAGVSDYDGSPEANYYYGVEGVVFAGNLDIGGGAGGGSRNGFMEAWGYVRGYVGANTSVLGGLYWDADDDFTDYGVYGEVEHRLAGTPVSFWANAFVGPYDDGFGYDVTEYGARVGVRIFCDPAGTTLQDHNRLMPF
jgi:hypothetical protein